MNSRSKGARGERGWRDELRANGYLKAYRSAQYCGVGPDASDVQAPELPFLHFEVKNVQRLALRAAFAQAQRDARSGKVPVLAHKQNHCPWLVTMSAETFFRLLNGSLG